MSLEEYSSQELKEELARRMLGDRPPPIRKWCDECTHFVAWKEDSEPPADFNPCSKGHKMRFRVPTPPMDDQWGFYKPGCKDGNYKGSD